jgi:uncharacterized protein YtpQ (UPF0354 family)
MECLLTRECKKEAFCLLFCKLLQEQLPGWSIHFTGETALRLIDPSRKESNLFLDNLWLRYSGQTEDRRELLEKYVRMARGMNADAPKVTRDSIVAMIKDLQYMGHLKPSTGAMSEHLCGDLYIVYAVDGAESIKTLSKEEMESIGLGAHELRELAVANLKRILPPVERHGDGPWYQVTAGTDYVASLLLFDSLWDQFANDVDGELVAAVPSRGVLLYTGALSMEGVAAIRKESEEIERSAPHAISSSLIVRKSSHWELFQPQ